jgi:hypothetical protein
LNNSILKGVTILYTITQHGKEREMKKGKGTWLPLALMLAAGSALLPVGCNTGDGSGTEWTDPIPDTTSVTFDGKPIWIGTESKGDNTSSDEHDHYHILQMRWDNKFQNKTDKIVITLGRDFLEDGMKFLIMGLVGPEEGSTISKADCDALKAKIKAGLPADSGKVVVDDNFSKVTKVAQYAAMIKDAFIRMAQSVRANIGRGA